MMKEVKDLLIWTHLKGLKPPLGRQIYLNLETNQVEGNRTDRSVWVPDIDGLKQNGLPICSRIDGDVVYVFAPAQPNVNGFGSCSHTAALSFLNQLRLACPF